MYKSGRYYCIQDNLQSRFILHRLIYSLITLLGVAHVDEGAVGELVEEGDSAGALVHEVVQSEARADTLGSIELILAVSIFLAKFSGTSRKLDKAQQTLVRLVLETDESGVVRVRVVSRQLIHVSDQHRVGHMWMVPIG